METLLGLGYNVWWFLVFGAVISGYAILDGFDLGAGALHLLLKKETSRRIALNAIGPVWDGNEVWLSLLKTEPVGPRVAGTASPRTADPTAPAVVAPAPDLRFR